MKIRKKVAAAFGLVLIMGCLGGCRFGKTSVVFSGDLGKHQVFKIGDTVCTLQEAKVYLCNYQNLYGSAYGIDLWEQEDGDGSLEKYVKDITISELTRVVCMDELAKQQKIVLTETEEAKAKEAAEDYYDSLTEAEIDYMDVSEGLLVEMYQDYALAQKLYMSLTEGVDDEVSDDEARVMEAQQIYVSTKERADQVQQALDSGRDFLSIAADYNEAGKIECIFARGDLPRKVEEAAFNIENDEITGCIHARDGYYYIKCINKFNQELTDEHKLTIVKQRKTAAFDNTYEAFVKEQDARLNTKLWETVKVEHQEDITTDSFFAVYEEYFSE